MNGLQSRYNTPTYTLIGVKRNTRGEITSYVTASADTGFYVMELEVNEVIMGLRKNGVLFRNLKLDSDNRTVKFSGVAESKYLDFSVTPVRNSENYTYILNKEMKDTKTLYHTLKAPSEYKVYEEKDLIGLQESGKLSLVNAKVVTKAGKKYISALRDTLPLLNEGKKKLAKLRKQQETEEKDNSRNTDYIRLEDKLNKKLEQTYVDLMTPFNEKGEVAETFDIELTDAYNRRFIDRLRKEGKQFSLVWTEVIIGNRSSLPLQANIKLVTITVETNKGIKNISFGVTGYYSSKARNEDVTYNLQEVIIIRDVAGKQEDIQRSKLKSFKRQSLMSKDSFFVPVALDNYLVDLANKRIDKYMKYIVSLNQQR